MTHPSEDPWTGGETTATIKGGKGFDEPWLVFRGPDAASVKKQVEEATGLSGEGISLMELVYNANYSFGKINTVATGLDAIVIKDDESAEEPEAKKPAAVPAPEPKDEGPDHAAALKELTVKADITAYYLKHKKEFDADGDLMEALKARYTSEEVK